MRASQSLPGGERFLVSLGLAWALSSLERRQGSCKMLLIDEGFGSLDSGSVELAMEASGTLQGLGRKVGVVTHVAATVERVPTQGQGWSSGAEGGAWSRFKRPQPSFTSRGSNGQLGWKAEGPLWSDLHDRADSIKDCHHRWELAAARAVRLPAACQSQGRAAPFLQKIPKRR